jgi:HD-GYP domain-containing protein (c-di-GMP phosphodiesterase class II)
VGTVLQSHMSPGQLLARYTSDQFAALLPGIDRDEAVCIAERLRIDVGTHLFTVAEQVEQLTVSIGAATCPDDAETSQAVMQAADHAMYLAKRAGRNQTFQSNAAFATLAPAHGRINDLLRQSPRETLSLLIRAMDQRLPERAGHSKRVTRYVMAIARELEVPSASLPRLRLAAYIHDIGMVSLPDSLLRKPGQLSAEERSLLRGVPVAAHGLLSQLDMHESILLAVLHQRENYDGTGYPAGLRGESIPLGSRIIAVADALDAMTSARAHREPMSLEQALEQVSQQSGRQFDPQVVEAAYCLTEVISESVTLSPHEDAEGAMAMPGVPSEMRS